MARDSDRVLRLFYGILLPAPIQQEVASLQERLRPCGAKVKWVAPENLHLTLNFLGEVAALALPDLKLAGAKVAAEMPAWDARLQGLGAFPKLKQPRTLWVGASEGAEPMAHLAGQLAHLLVEEALVACDDRKPFHAHCTFGRVKAPQGVQALVKLMEQENKFTASPFRCDQFQLMASELEASGPRYTVLASFSLGLER